jgi:regulator of protease activity HflC (stomatin/prohibitin superfamily)
MKESTLKKIIGYSIASVVGIVLLAGSVYTVDEGHVGIVKRFSEAKEQVNPGLHFKFPFVDSVEEMEVRTRKNVEDLAAATAEQMPVIAKVSVNWTVDRNSALDLFKKYGGLGQFEARILDPRLRSAAKVAISKYYAEQLVKERNLAITDIQKRLIVSMEGFNVNLDSIQIENLSLPPAYLKTIEVKLNEKNLADAEEHKLRKQGLVAQQAVNISKAQAEGIELVSIQKAAAIQREGLAEAASIDAKGKALLDNPLIVQLTHEQQWNGSLVTTILGSSTGIIIQEDKLIK